MNVNDLATPILAGDRAALARAITLVESTRHDHRATACELVNHLLPHTGNSIRVAITGVPGVGKSTFIESLGTQLTTERNEKVAVLAVDPSSPVSGGSVLGDKTRMPRLSTNSMAFVRPTATGGGLGGVHRKTREAILLCEAAGFPNILIETVGVGQSEFAVTGMADFLVLLLLPNAGDELQGIKRGIVEVSDLIAVNKADADRASAEIARRSYESAVSLLAPSGNGWVTPVLVCSGLTGENVPAIWKAALQHRELTKANGSFEAKRRKQLLQWMDEEMRDGMVRLIASHQDSGRLRDAVAAGRLSPAKAAAELLSKLR